MIYDLDQTLKQLLIREGGLDPSAVDIRFNLPTPDQLHSLSRPIVSLYMYDVHENVEQREIYWDTVREGDHHVRLTRRPVRIDVSYRIACFAGNEEEQHRLLWQVLHTLFRNSPLPEELLEGDLKHLLRPAEMRVAQPDGAIKDPGQIWEGMQVKMPPSINLVVTVDLDLDLTRTEPVVFARTLKIGQTQAAANQGSKALAQKLEPGWEAAPMELGGIVRDSSGRPLSTVAVRLIASRPDGRATQVGPSTSTDETGRYRFQHVPVGDYVLVVEAPGHVPLQQPVRVVTGERGEPLPDLVYLVEVPMHHP